MAARTAPFGMCAIIQAVNELEEKEEEKEKQLPSWNREGWPEGPGW